MSRERDKEQKKGDFTPFPEQNEDGVDLSLIRANLQLTPTERIRRANRFQRGLVRLLQHVKRRTS